MSRSRGNKNSKPKILARQTEELRLMNEGEKLKDIAASVGVSKVTLWRDIQKMSLQFAEGNAGALAQLKKMQVGALLQLVEELHDGELSPDVGNSIRGFLDSVSKILGLDAPTKHLTARVDGTDMRFKAAIAGLSENQIESVYDFARSLAREKQTQVVDASWFPQPEQKALPE